MPEKIFNINLTINWKTGTVKIYKRPLKKVHPLEIPISLSLSIKTPENKKVNISGSLILPEVKVSDMAVAYIEDKDEDK